MKNAIFGFSTVNLGDDVQSLAAALVFQEVDCYVDRDRLDRVRVGENHRLIMNSWFAIKRYKAVPSADLDPIYFGFCVGRPELINKAWLGEWRKQPYVGCRDRHSVSLLLDNGIDAKFTGCLTTWMGKFIKPAQRRSGILFLDVPEEVEPFIPQNLRNCAERISNATGKGENDQLARFRAVADILDRIRCAEMVVTRRLHAALPCVGMGTPVTVYLHGSDKNRNRFSGADEFLPMVFHKNGQLEGERGWIEPSPAVVPTEMEDRFLELAARLGTDITPRWASFREFADTLPSMPREPQGLLKMTFSS